MESQRPARKLLDWFRADRRRPLAAAGVVAVFVGVAAAAGVLLTSGGDGTVVGPTATPFVGVCNEPTLIDALPAEPEGDWESVQAPEDSGCFSMTAAVFDAGGVAPDTAFVLESAEPQDAADLAERILVEPAVELSVEAEGDPQVSLLAPGEAYLYRIEPASALAAGQVYRFTLLDKPDGLPVRSWAFQTQQPLRVVQTLPADMATGVATNVGIELTFSHDGVTGAEERFEITPATEGRFEVHKRVLVFVPNELAKATLYTVTLRAGASLSGSGQTMEQDFQFQFETGASDRTGDTPGPPALQFSRRAWESSTQEKPAVALFGAELASATTLPFTVYRFPDMDAFLAALDEFTSVPSWAYVTRGRTTIDTSGLEVATTFSAETQSQGQYADRYVVFPEALPQGLYVVEATYQGGPLQTLLQVTDVGAYASISEPKTLVWANDLATKSPLAGAVVTSTGPAISETTGADGIALFDTPADMVVLEPSYYGYTTTKTVGNLIVTAADGRAAVVPLADIFSGYQSYGFREYGFKGDPSLYWRFLYTERDLYHPTDSVRFWGLLRLRENPPPSQEVEVRLSGTSYYDISGYYRPLVVAQTSVTTSETGTFIGELPFQGVSPGYYTLEARVGEQSIATTYLEIKDFVKPAYKIDILPERTALFEGESMDVVVRASFFDGTPVAGLAVTYRDGKNAEQQLTTDARGEATVRYDATNPGYTTYGGYYGTGLTAMPVNAEEGEISGSAWVQVFPTDIYVDATAEYESGQAAVTGTVYSVDLSRINSGTKGDFSDFRGPPVAGRTVSINVTEESYNKVDTGQTTYDFIQKIVRKVYRYDPVHIPIGSFQAVSDGDGNFRIAFPAERNKSYRIALSAADNSGRTFTNELYLYSGLDYYSTWPTLGAGKGGSYALGDEVTVTMSQGDEPYPTGGGNRYLFYQAQNGLRNYAAIDGPVYAFTFAEEHIPNVSIIGVRFTGSTYVEASYPFYADYDQSERELTVDVQPQDEKYEPGGEATLDVTVTNVLGQPVEAEVLLSAVDEAVFRAQGESFFYDQEILEGLYTGVASGVLTTYASHQYPNPSSGAERGGDGGARENFEDVALFQTVTTDGNGHATASFELPDNITSWRVTALAVTPDLHAGKGMTLVPVGLPLFLDVALNTSYLVTDQPSVKVRAFGDSLSAGEQVAIEVTSPTLLASPLQASGTAFVATDVALPALVEGRHELHFKVSAGGLEDEIVRTIEVVPSRLLRDESHYYELGPGEGADLEGSPDRQTTVVIADHNRGRYYPTLGSLSWTWGDRLDQMLARNMAQELMLQYFGEEPAFPAEFRAAAYQTQDGGLAILPFADNDLTLSARVAAMAPEKFGQQTLAQYLRNVFNDPDETRERAIIAMFGLAALGEPLLTDIQQAAALDDLTPREKLYLGLAAAELGDQDTAGRLYAGLLEDFGERRGPAIRLNVGADSDDILEATSLAAGLGAMLGDDFAPLLFEYTTHNYTRETLVELEQITYLVDALPRLSQAPVSFSYTVDGSVHDETLDRGKSVSLKLSPEQLDALNLQVAEGAVGVSTTFLSPFDVASVEVDPAVSISRSYAGQTDTAVTLNEGDLVRITMTWNLTQDAVDGCYQVSDMLPSGLRPVTRLWEQGIVDPKAWYPYFVEGQRVSFCVWRDSTEKTIVYYARVIGTGTYTAEPVVMQSQQAQESIGVTGALEVEIR